MLTVGSPAPDFALAGDSGATVRLAELKGRQVVVYFYPRDDTPGCTKQACGIRDAWDAFAATGAVVLGVSLDGQAAHERFRAKFELPFTLLSDPDHAVAEAYGAWGEKSMYGKRYMGIVRSTVVVGADGKVKAVFPKVKPDAHARQVLDALEA
jgi:peroxiredoxin Q/BCP